MNKNSQITIIGGSIVGCSVALELAQSGFTNIAVIEKNETIPGLNQSSTNEGTIHSGIYYPQDTMPLKAKLCVEGNALMYEFLEKQGLSYVKNGKLIVATDQQEEEYLDFFLQVGKENNVPNLKKISGSKALDMEPNLKNITSALLIPSTGSTAPNVLLTKIKELCEQSGVLFKLGIQVIAIDSSSTGFIIHVQKGTKNDEIQTEILINSAGLFSDKIAKMVNPEFPYEIEPIRGEFAWFNRSVRKDIWMNGMHVYQPPYCYTVENGIMKVIHVQPDQLRKKLKEGSIVITAGIHLSPAFENKNGVYALQNKVTISPLKTAIYSKEDYKSNLHPQEDYIKKVQSFFPNVKKEDLTIGHAGIMGPLKGYRDFIIQRDVKFPNCIQLVGMESPAFSACFAIGKYVANLLG